MRNIKFRVWFVESKEMVFTETIQHLLFKDGHYYNHSGALEPITIMQYTGLKDNTKWKDLTEREREEWTRNGNMPSKWNGREIYVGLMRKNRIIVAQLNGFIPNGKL